MARIRGKKALVVVVVAAALFFVMTMSGNVSSFDFFSAPLVPDPLHICGNEAQVGPWPPLKGYPSEQLEGAEGTNNAWPFVAPRASRGDPLGAFTKFAGDTTPGSGDLRLKPANVSHVSECAQMCLDWRENTENPPCHGFVVEALPMEEFKCYFKAVPFVATKSVKHSYFLEPRYRSDASIVYAVLAGPKYLNERLYAQMSTFLRDTRSVIFLEANNRSHAALENFTKSNPFVCSVKSRVTFLEEPPEGHRRQKNGAWKDLPILLHMHDTYPEAPWLAIMDDDTFVIDHNLRILLATYFRDQSVPRIIGQTYVFNGEFMFAHGGCGILINRPARLKLLEFYDECLERCLQYAGDVRLGCCAKIAGVTFTFNSAFWSQLPTRAMAVDKRDTVTPFPVSFHNMRTANWTLDLQTVVNTVMEPRACKDRELPWHNSTFCMRSRAGAKPWNNPLTWDAIRTHYEVTWKRRYTAFHYTDPSLVHV